LQESRAHQEKLYEIQGDTEEEGGKDSDQASTSKKSDQAGVVQEANEDACDVLMAESGKGKYSDAWLLDLSVHTTCPKKGSGSVLRLMMEALS